MGERKVWWYFWEYEVLKEEKMVDDTGYRTDGPV